MKKIVMMFSAIVVLVALAAMPSSEAEARKHYARATNHDSFDRTQTCFTGRVTSITSCVVRFVTCDDQTREYPFRTDIDTGLPAANGATHIINIGDEGEWCVSTGTNPCNINRPWVSGFTALECGI